MLSTMKGIVSLFIIGILCHITCLGQHVLLKTDNFSQDFKKNNQKILKGIRAWEKTDGSFISNDSYSSSSYRDNTIGIQKVISIVRLQLRTLDRQKNLYQANCIDTITGLLVIPHPYSNKIYGYDLSNNDSDEKSNTSLLSQYGSGKLMDMFQNTIMDDTNKVGGLFYFLKEEQYWRDNFMVLNKKTGKTSFYLSARDTNPFRKFTGSKAFKEIGSIKELIDYRYGSVEKLAELLEDEQEEQSCKCTIGNVAEMEETIKQSWQIRMKYMSEDTVKAMRQFMGSLQKVAALDSNQMRILEGNIQFRDAIPFIENCTESSDASFYINRKSYGSFIKKSLTRSQYAKCLKFFKQQADCAKRIHFYMWHYTGKDDIEDRIRAILKK